MKFIRYKKFVEGEIQDTTNTFLVFGKSYLIDGSFSGWKFIFNFFLKQQKKYICPNTFEHKEGLCIFKVGLMYRNKYNKLWISKVWVPVN